MSFGYSVKKIEQNMAKAQGSDLGISFKQSIEICNYIRGNPVQKAKQKLEDAIAMKKPIPFKRFTNGLGHKKGNITTGRYPIKACQQILKLINSAESNALFKGLNSKGLIICHISAKQSAGAWHYGRKSRRQMKKCHIEIIVKEEAQKKTQDKKEVKKVESKPKVKPEAKPEVKAEVKSEPVKTEQVEKKVESKVEEKKEEVKLEEAKIEEAKPEEAKPEEPKTEEAKPEEAKPEEKSVEVKEEKKESVAEAKEEAKE